MGQLGLVISNVTSWARWIGEGFIGLIAIALIVAAFASSKGSATRVVVIVGCSLLAAVVVWQLPEWLKLAANDSPSITGVGSSGRY